MYIDTPWRGDCLALNLCLRTGDCPWDSWFSQWCGAFYLDPMDHYVKRELKVPGYLRYMDDFVLFSDDQSHLESARSLLEEWLAENRGLALNPKHQMVLPNRAPGVFLGYRVSRSGISPSRKLRRRMKRRLIILDPAVGRACRV